MNEILLRHLELHNKLGQQVDAEDKEVFDTEHRQIWGNCEVDLSLRYTDLKAKPKPSIDEIYELKELDNWFQITK